MGRCKDRTVVTTVLVMVFDGEQIDAFLGNCAYRRCRESQYQPRKAAGLHAFIADGYCFNM